MVGKGIKLRTLYMYMYNLHNDAFNKSTKSPMFTQILNFINSMLKIQSCKL